METLGNPTEPIVGALSSASAAALGCGALVPAQKPRPTAMGFRVSGWGFTYSIHCSSFFG